MRRERGWYAVGWKGNAAGPWAAFCTKEMAEAYAAKQSGVKGADVFPLSCVSYELKPKPRRGGRGG